MGRWGVFGITTSRSFVSTAASSSSTAILKYIIEGEDLLNQPFQRLVRERQLLASKYDGFWASMDNFKDKQLLEDLYAKGDAPGEQWKRPFEPGVHPALPS